MKAKDKKVVAEAQDKMLAARKRLLSAYRSGNDEQIKEARADVERRASLLENILDLITGG